MFSFCKDLAFTEELKRAGFQETYVLIFADDRLFYDGSTNGIYMGIFVAVENYMALCASQQVGKVRKYSFKVVTA